MLQPTVQDTITRVVLPTVSCHRRFNSVCWQLPSVSEDSAFHFVPEQGHAVEDANPKINNSYRYLKRVRFCDTLLQLGVVTTFPPTSLLDHLLQTVGAYSGNILCIFSNDGYRIILTTNGDYFFYGLKQFVFMYVCIVANSPYYLREVRLSASFNKPGP